MRYMTIMRARPATALAILVVMTLMALAMLPAPVAAAGPPDGFTPEIRITFDQEASYFPEIVIDQDDNIHLFWLNSTGRDLDNLQARDGQVHYTKVSPYGETLVPPKRVLPIYPDDGGEFWITKMSVDLDPEGDIHLAWADDHTGLFTVYHVELDQEGEVKDQVTGLTNTTPAKYPSLDVDKRGDVHIAWAQWEIFGEDNPYPNIYYTELDEDGGAVVPRVPVTQTFLASNHPALAVDHGNNAHIVFEENVNLPGYTDEIYYCVVDPAGELVVDMSRVSYQKGSSLRPDIAIDQIDVPHVVWMNLNVEVNIYFTKITDAGSPQIMRVTNTKGESNNPSIYIGKGMDNYILWSENIYIGIRENSRVWFSVIDDDWATRTPPTILTFDGLGAEVPVIAMDGYDNLLVAWDDIRVDPASEEKVWDIYYMRTVVDVNLDPIDVLEVNGVPVDSDMELRFLVGDEVVLSAVNSSDPNGWDEVVQYNFTVTHEEFIEASGWTQNSTFRYTFHDEGVYIVYVKVKDRFDSVNSRPNSVLITVTKRPVGASTPFFANPSVKGSVVAGGIGLTATLGYLVAGTEIGKYKFMTMLMVPLYSRIKKEKTLDNYIRGQIHGYILAKPGCHYNQIKQTLNLNNGTLAYHLRKLEREEFIKSERDGMYKRFYPVGLKVPKRMLKLSAMQRRILEVIRMTPGISQKEVATEVGISAPAVIYHIGVLAGAKLVKREKKGSRVEYRALGPDEDEMGLPGPIPASSGQ